MTLPIDFTVTAHPEGGSVPYELAAAMATTLAHMPCSCGWSTINQPDGQRVHLVCGPHKRLTEWHAFLAGQPAVQSKPAGGEGR